VTSRAEAQVTICNKRGLHARAAARVCETAAPFQSSIKVSKDGTTVGATSLMALLMLGAGIGSQVTLTAEGEDADEAIGALKALIEDRFHEDE